MRSELDNITKVCGCESANFYLLSFLLGKTTLFNNAISKTVQVLTVILSQNWSLSQCGALQPLSVFIATNSHCSIELFSALPGCCPLRRTPFSNVVRMRTSGLIPKPKTTVIGLGVRLVHKWNRELTRQRTAGTVVVVVKAYAIGKALHLRSCLTL